MNSMMEVRTADSDNTSAGEELLLKDAGWLALCSLQSERQPGILTAQLGPSACVRTHIHVYTRVNTPGPRAPSFPSILMLATQQLC